MAIAIVSYGTTEYFPVVRPFIMLYNQDGSKKILYKLIYW